MLGGWSDVPSVDSMWGVCAAVVGLLVNENASSWRSKWSAVVVEGTVELSVGGEIGVHPRTAEEVQGGQSLWEELIPKVKGEVGIGAA